MTELELELSFTHLFPYSDIDGSLKPVITVSFEYNGLGCAYPMLIDSGAKLTALPPEYGVHFGIDIQMLPEVDDEAGFMGPWRYRRLENVNICIVEGEIEVLGPICFAEALIGCSFGVLGREAVFDTLRIAFRQRKCICPYIYMAVDDNGC